MSGLGSVRLRAKNLHRWNRGVRRGKAGGSLIARPTVTKSLRGAVQPDYQVSRGSEGRIFESYQW